MQQLLQSLWLILMMWKTFDFEVEFEHPMIVDIEDADTMLGQYEKVPEQMFLSDDAQLDGVHLHYHNLWKLPHQ